MTNKEIVRLLVGFLLVTIAIFVGTKVFARRFDPGTLRHMIEYRGRSKQFVNDPCAFSIVGEPNAGDQYVKLNITCKKGGRSLNTFDVAAIEAGTLEALLLSFHRINGISAETKGYICKMDSAPIILTSKLSFPTTIECIYE